MKKAIAIANNESAWTKGMTDDQFGMSSIAGEFKDLLAHNRFAGGNHGSEQWRRPVSAFVFFLSWN
jgi:hypothetical protein